jgi:hypothetical protein
MEAQIEAFLNVLSNTEPINFTCYPNPFSDQLYVLLSSGGNKEEEVTVVDLMGRCVYREWVRLDAGMNLLDVQCEVAPGVYVLRIGGQTQRIVRY